MNRARAARVHGPDISGPKEHYAATVGLTYRFNKRDWTPGVPYAAAVAYMEMIDKLNHDIEGKDKALHHMGDRMRKNDALIKKLVNDNKMLHDQIKNHKCPDAKVVSTAMVYFDLNSAKITDKTEVTLDALAQVLKKAPKDQKFVITGHADSQTGTPEYNQKLSEKRAEAVYNYLVEKGIDKDRLTYVGNGPTMDYHKSPRANRMAYIK